MTFTSSDIIAMDETAVWMDAVSNKTVEVRGTKTISLASTGHDKANITEILSAASSGVKKKPLCIFKGKGNTHEDKKIKNCRDIYIAYTDNGWCNDDVARKWLDLIFPSCFRQLNRLLIWDSYRCHISKSTKDYIKKNNITPVVLPGGTTSILQAPDVSWNKPFKSKLRELYDDWLEFGEKTYTKHGNIRAPSKVTICDMVLEAWESISQELIEKSFRVCGQTKNAKPEDIDCLKKDRSCENAFDSVSGLWDKVSENVDALDEVEDDDEMFKNEVVIEVE